MWCYQKPGFEALLLAELQRQQQRSQFCDTLLKADGVSVPAHSCVLSAISPHVSTALSSTPAPPAGQSRLLEFHALGSCTLLRMVRLLYSGEMTGEGEQEKQEAISAAANLGIHGLVEVTERDHRGRNDGGGSHHMEVGVQTEPLIMEKNEGRQSTQTEELQVNTASFAHCTASFDTIDVAALQMDSQLVHPDIPYIPISLVYPAENHISQLSSAPAASMQNSAAAGETSVAIMSQPYTTISPSAQNFSTMCDIDPKSWWVAPQTAARDVTDSQEFEQFQDNIPGFINFFLNPVKEDAPCRGRAGRRQRARAKRTRRAGTGERRARRPQAATGGRGRGGLMQTVDVQDVGVSRLQKQFLQRWGSRVSRTGQGGGAVGRRLDLKSREFLKKFESSQKRGRRGKMCEFSESVKALPHNEAGGGKKRSVTQQLKQVSVPFADPQRAEATTSAIPSTPMQIYNMATLSSASLQPSLCPPLLSPAAHYMPPASPLLHTTCLPSPAPLPQVDQPEQIDRLLEEVMMGLDIIPKNNNSAPQCPPPTRSSSCSYASPGNNMSQNRQQGSTTGLPHVADVARGASDSTSAQCEVPVLQQQGEGELNMMLEHFLQSFEQHVDNCRAREAQEMEGESSTEPSRTSSVRKKHSKTKAQTKTSQSALPQNTHCPVSHSQTSVLQQSNQVETTSVHSQTLEASAGSPVPVEHTKKPPEKVKRVYKRKRNDYLFSLERKRTRIKKSTSTSVSKTNMLHDLGDKQLQQMPVVRLERSRSMSVTATLQAHGGQRLEVKTPSSEKYPRRGRSSVKNQPALWSTKTYPLRSRFRDAQITDSLPFLHEPLHKIKQPPSAGRPDSRQTCPMENGTGKLLTPPDVESSIPSIQPERTCDLIKDHRERREADLTVEPQEEAEGATVRGTKRSAEAKRVFTEPMSAESELPSDTRVHGCDSVSEQDATDAEEVIDVETVSLTSAGGGLKSEEQDKNTVKIEINLKGMGEETESSGDEIIDVDGDTDGQTDLEEPADKSRCQNSVVPHFAAPASHPAKEGNVGSKGSWEDKDIDVIGAFSPHPRPEQVILSWMETSRGEDENEDVDDV
ncbi:uncharacterized protein LOC131472246 [Solea solea]|uniref:uncharacterized protein LOC131472246 n=1 Tax=Solea solea TaxID=90069 RepID=UPI00272BF367|nr:uncharacterized protein LOC131472246 [Solea solea]